MFIDPEAQWLLEQRDASYVYKSPNAGMLGRGVGEGRVPIHVSQERISTMAMNVIRKRAAATGAALDARITSIFRSGRVRDFQPFSREAASGRALQVHVPARTGTPFVSDDTDIEAAGQAFSGYGGLGQEPLSLIDYVRETGETVVAIKPLATFIGAHPWLTVSMIMAAIIAGGAVGGYIGASAQEVKKKKAR